MAERGWQCEGIEPSAEAASAARERGFEVFCGSVEDAPAPSRPYDLIVAWMTLEHLHDPVHALRLFHDWTAPAGRLALSVPNAGGWQRRLFGEYWYDLSIPTHLFHFTPWTLRLVLEAAGWAVERILYQRVLTDCVVSPGYLLEASGRLPGLSRRLIDFPAWRWSAFALYPLALPMSMLRMTSRLTVWARKSGALTSAGRCQS
jgi:SAM-dependent methyltransferase